MSRVLAIARREWRSFCTSTQAPVIAAVFLVLCGLYYDLLVTGYADASLATLRSGRPVFLNLHVGIFHKLYGVVVYFLVFLLPAVAMRLVSGEYRSGRIDLILSWPVGERSWILGKWLSAVGVAKLLLLGTVFFFLLTMVLGRLTEPQVAPTWQPLLTALIGLSLLSGAVAAWSVLASTVVGHQAAAYFLGLACGFVLLMLGSFVPHLPPGLAAVAAELSLGDHFVRFAGGIIDARDVVYFLGLTAVSLAAATAVLDGRRLPPRRRGRTWLPVLAVLLAAVFLQIVAVRRPLRVDLTPDRFYSLAPQTERILEVLDRERPDPDGPGRLPPPEVEAVAFYEAIDGARQNIQALLQSCADRTPRFRFRIVDPNYEPQLLQELDVAVVRTVVLISEGRRRHLLDPDEAQLASAVYRLVTDTRPVAYWMLGHGEMRLDVEDRGGASQLAGMLADAGYSLRPLVLPERRLLPPDADLIIWAGPQLDPDPATLDLLHGFLVSGGAVACFFGPDAPAPLQRWTERYNVKQRDDVVIAPTERSALAGVGLRTVTVVEGYTNHPAVQRLQGVATTFPLVQTLGHLQREMPGVDGEILLLIGPDAWGETDPQTRYAGRPRFDPERDHPGPQPFGVALHVADPQAGAPAAPGAQDGPAGAASGRLVIIGSSAFLNNANIGLYGNRDLVLNLLGWLAAEPDLLDLRGRRVSFQPLLLDDGARRWLRLAVLLWPGLISLTWLGLVLHRQRRH